jgi:hypothetical protein
MQESLDIVFSGSIIMIHHFINEKPTLPCLFSALTAERKKYRNAIIYQIGCTILINKPY